MGKAHIRPETLEEKLIFWSIVGTWAVWLLGALYLLAPIIGWILIFITIMRRFNISPVSYHKQIQIPIECVAWIMGMLIMLVALVVGHADFDLGLQQTFKSIAGWMKGWALLAVFVAVGATMRIRPNVLYRATNILAAQTLLLAPLFITFFLLHLPRTLYVSPLEFMGGPGREFFRVSLYFLGDEAGGVRFGFFAPWAPGAALVASVAIVIGSYDCDKRWAAIGMMSALVVCLMSQSRMALVAIPAVYLLTLILSDLTRPRAYWFFACLVAAAIPMISGLTNTVDDIINRFNGARPASSRVRATLQTIARHRWQNEAPIWGHGTVERGPHLVEFMPIGSHHSWNGLLFVKGFAGVLALAGPMAISILFAITKAQSDRASRASLGVLLTLLIYSFGENLEVLVYLYWPGLVIVGIAMKRRYVHPFHRFFLGQHLPSHHKLSNES